MRPENLTSTMFAGNADADGDNSLSATMTEGRVLLEEGGNFRSHFLDNMRERSQVHGSSLPKRSRKSL